MRVAFANSFVGGQMQQGPQAPHWNIATRIAFRFGFV
jgi:hypothetical protein